MRLRTSGQRRAAAHEHRASVATFDGGLRKAARKLGLAVFAAT